MGGGCEGVCGAGDGDCCGAGCSSAHRHTWTAGSRCCWDCAADDGDDVAVGVVDDGVEDVVVEGAPVGGGHVVDLGGGGRGNDFRLHRMQKYRQSKGLDPQIRVHSKQRESLQSRSSFWGLGA